MSNSRASIGNSQRRPLRDFTTLSIESGAARASRVSRNYNNPEELFDQNDYDTRPRSFSEGRNLMPNKQDTNLMKSAKVPFYKTKTGIIVLSVIGAVVGLCIVGGIIGVTYYAGSLNARNITLSSSENSASFDSQILSDNEKSAFINMTGFKTFTLCYRATQDGFFSNIFHKNCDGKQNTVSIIRSHMNSVFGGYAQVAWTVGGVWRTDANAFLFSLRRRGVSNAERFNVTGSGNAIYNHNNYGPTFGSGHDIFICDNSDIIFSSYTSYCSSYQCPTLYVTANTYLAGTYNFFTTEIEVFVVTF